MARLLEQGYNTRHWSIYVKRAGTRTLNSHNADWGDEHFRMWRKAYIWHVWEAFKDALIKSKDTGED